MTDRAEEERPVGTTADRSEKVQSHEQPAPHPQTPQEQVTEAGSAREPAGTPDHNATAAIGDAGDKKSGELPPAAGNEGMNERSAKPFGTKVRDGARRWWEMTWTAIWLGLLVGVQVLLFVWHGTSLSGLRSLWPPQHRLAFGDYFLWVLALVPSGVAVLSHRTVEIHFSELQEYLRQPAFERLSTLKEKDSHRPAWGYTFLAGALMMVIFDIVALSVGIRDKHAASAWYRTPDELLALNGIIYAGLGAYVYTVILTISRLNASALGAKFLFLCTLRTAIALVLGFCGSQIIPFSQGASDTSTASTEQPAPDTETEVVVSASGHGSTKGGRHATNRPVSPGPTGNGAANFTYFALGLFPNLAWTLLSRRAREALQVSYEGDEVLSVRLIQGIDTSVEDRLAEMGIQDVQHLAAADPEYLALKTVYPLRRVVDWIDQAVLIKHVGKDVTVFRRFGIAKATTLFELLGKNEPELGKPPTGPAVVSAATLLRDVADESHMKNSVIFSLLADLRADPAIQLVNAYYEAFKANTSTPTKT